MEATELTWQTHYFSLTRQIQTKLNFKLFHALGPQNSGQYFSAINLLMPPVFRSSGWPVFRYPSGRCLVIPISVTRYLCTSWRYFNEI